MCIDLAAAEPRGSLLIQDSELRNKLLVQTWYDWRKAFDSLSQSYLAKLLALMGFDPALVNWLAAAMKKWATTIILPDNTTISPRHSHSASLSVPAT